MITLINTSVWSKCVRMKLAMFVLAAVKPKQHRQEEEDKVGVSGD